MGLKMWKAYFFAWSFLSFLSLLGKVLKPEWRGFAALAVDAFMLIALYGFCFKKRIAWRGFWKSCFIVFMSVRIILFINGFWAGYSLYPDKLNILINVLLVGMILSLPLYVSTYLYAFRRNDIWGEGVLPE